MIDMAAKRHPSTIFRSYGAGKTHKKQDLHIDTFDFNELQGFQDVAQLLWRKVK
jgi:hypothetical protein